MNTILSDIQKKKKKKKKKKNVIRIGPPLVKLSGSVHADNEIDKMLVFVHVTVVYVLNGCRSQSNLSTRYCHYWRISWHARIAGMDSWEGLRVVLVGYTCL